MGYCPEIGSAKIKQLIPINDMIPLIKVMVDEPEEYGGRHEEFQDVIPYGWGIYYALFSEKEEFDNGISTSDVGFYAIPPDCFDSGFKDPDDVKLVPKYKCDNCHNRMTPSLIMFENKKNSYILYRCPICNTEKEMSYIEPTVRML